MRNRLALCLIITAMLAMTANASLQMYLDKSFTVPGASPITQLQFADWDRDGIPEVAALSVDSDVVIYSITGDSIILAYRNDSIPANPVSILFADVTRDSIPDLVLQYVTNVVLGVDSADHIYDLLDGAFGLARTQRAIHKGWGNQAALRCVRMTGISIYKKSSAEPTAGRIPPTVITIRGTVHGEVEVECIGH